MKRSTLKLAILFIIVGTVTASCVRDKEMLATKELHQIENYIGQPFSIVEEEFGAPDMEGKDAIASLYISETDDNNSPLSKYEIFVSWGDEIGCYGIKYFTDGENATSAYESALTYMGEDGRTVNNVYGYSELAFFTDEIRMSRRLDNRWEVDKRVDDQGSHVILVVSDIENRSCHSEVVAEAMRIEQEYGLIGKEDDLLFHQIDF